MKRSRKRYITRKRRSYRKRRSRRLRQSMRSPRKRSRRSHKRRSHKRRSHKRRSHKRRYLMKGGASGVTNHPKVETSRWENMIAELRHPEKIAMFMHGIHEKLKATIGEHHNLEHYVENIKENERLQTVLCYISLKPVEHLTDKLELLKKMALVAEKEIRENQLELGHKGDHETRKESLAAYVSTVEESSEELTDERKHEIQLLKVMSYLPEWCHHLLGLFRLDEIMAEITVEKEKLHAEIVELQSKATDKAHELGDKAHELGSKGNELLVEIHVEDYVGQLKQKSDTIKKKLEAKGVSEALVTDLFAKVQKDIGEKVGGEAHVKLDDKLHIIEREGKELEEILRVELKGAKKNTEEIEVEVALLMKEVKEHVVALHIHERLHMVHKIGIEIFMGLLLISIFVEDFTKDTDKDIGFTHLPVKAVALLKALSEKTLEGAIDFAFKGALKHFGVFHLSDELMGVCAKKLGKTVKKMKDLDTLNSDDIDKLVKELSDKEKARIIYAYNQKRFAKGVASSAKGVVEGVSDTLKATEEIFGDQFLELLTGSEETSTAEVKVQKQPAAVTQIAVAG